MIMPSQQNTHMRGFQPKTFVPVWQESDHGILYDHTSTAISNVAITTVNIEKGVNALLVQAITQNLRYVLVGTPSATSGFRLTAGNDPIAIRVVEGMTVQFIGEVLGGFLEMQFGRMQ